MHRVGARASTRVQVERLALLIAVQSHVQTPVREENTTAEEAVELDVQLSQPVEQLRCDRIAAKILDQLGVIDAVLRIDFPRGDDLLLVGLGCLCTSSRRRSGFSSSRSRGFRHSRSRSGRSSRLGRRGLLVALLGLLALLAGELLALRIEVAGRAEELDKLLVGHSLDLAARAKRMLGAHVLHDCGNGMVLLLLHAVVVGLDGGQHGVADVLLCDDDAHAARSLELLQRRLGPALVQEGHRRRQLLWAVDAGALLAADELHEHRLGSRADCGLELLRRLQHCLAARFAELRRTPADANGLAKQGLDDLGLLFAAEDLLGLALGHAGGDKHLLRDDHGAHVEEKSWVEDLTPSVLL
eukprot:m.9961 g.9961  ORF g.9961 m.9961 type:complete len:356 (+) comp5101_c0_seq1:1091-2158(+)